MKPKQVFRVRAVLADGSPYSRHFFSERSAIRLKQRLEQGSQKFHGTHWHPDWENHPPALEVHIDKGYAFFDAGS